jgi:hypothetical protein
MTGTCWMDGSSLMDERCAGLEREDVAVNGMGVRSAVGKTPLLDGRCLESKQESVAFDLRGV